MAFISTLPGRGTPRPMPKWTNSNGMDDVARELDNITSKPVNLDANLSTGLDTTCEYERTRTTWARTKVETNMKEWRTLRYRVRRILADEPQTGSYALAAGASSALPRV
ncbi:hypothetical protein FRB90_000996 [Tulasnella sp. 427]|nr:hypothetical protein FRB90_000996 [Tulasnella sp. 427]